MSAEIFLAFALGAFLVSLVWLGYYCRHACDDLAVPDVHGDYPAVPPEVIEKARVEARIRETARGHEQPIPRPDARLRDLAQMNACLPEVRN